tara:strand:+ start:27884 stop:28129 length:246 start_codon:yes stop_codon:yes gene_type:complete
MTTEQTQFELDWSKSMNINGMESNKGYYNLIVSIRDVSLWTKFKMKPHRHWQIGQVKKYFGLQGNAKVILQRLTDFRDGNL